MAISEPDIWNVSGENKVCLGLKKVIPDDPESMRSPGIESVFQGGI